MAELAVRFALTGKSYLKISFETKEGIMELLNRTFTSQSVALATGLDPKAIQNWASRGLIVGQRDGTGKGFHLRFSWFNVMEVALADALMKVGMSSIQDAFAAAQLFAHTGEGPSGYAGETTTENIRIPSLPWHHSLGETILIVHRDGCSVKLVSNEGTVDLWGLTPAGLDFTGFIVLNVSEIFRHVCFRMAQDYREVLDEAYRDEAEEVSE